MDLLISLTFLPPAVKAVSEEDWSELDSRKLDSINVLTVY